jgi:hypothetical protein
MLAVYDASSTRPRKHRKYLEQRPELYLWIATPSTLPCEEGNHTCLPLEEGRGVTVAREQ